MGRRKKQKPAEKETETYEVEKVVGKRVRNGHVCSYINLKFHENSFLKHPG